MLHPTIDLINMGLGGSLSLLPSHFPPEWGRGYLLGLEGVTKYLP